ncbi:MAG: carboxyvinyl-carboxyphosphonate phosphorylmutase [Ramlibacter sp.]|nr:carboxyvinyl-carboxyphosphonate phosphorylmutase [Ramlibacter sp.]
MTPTDRLRELIRQPGILQLPGCFDPLSTKIAFEAGFDAVFLGGFGISAARLGLPDTGLISFAEVLDTVRNCAGVSGRKPLVVDGDTGFGNAINVRRTVQELARAGVAAITIEDQVSPKRCGHTRGKQVVSREEASMKIRAAVEARGQDGPLIIARTDARSVLGFEEAWQRCKAFESEGADLIFMEGPRGRDEMELLCRSLKTPCVFNMVNAGDAPPPTARELASAGFKVGLLPVDLLSASVAAMRHAAAAIASGVRPEAPISFAELQSVVGFPEYFDEEKKYAIASDGGQAT